MDTNVIREALLKQPFKPFTLRLADGREIPVRHREIVAVSRRRVFVIHPDESSSDLEPLLIVSLEYAADGQKTVTDSENP